MIDPFFYAIFKSLKAEVWVPGHTEKMIDPILIRVTPVRLSAGSAADLRPEGQGGS
jgi:hypothetical protein